MFTEQSETVQCQDPCSRTPGPFVHKFCTDRHHYVYDINLNSVVRLDPIEYAILDDFGSLAPEDIVQKHCDLCPREPVMAAWQNLHLAHTQGGYFSANRPQRMVYPYDESALRRIYEEKISTLLLSVTEQCNMRCEYCAFSGAYPLNRVHSSKQMPWEVARKAIDFLRAHSKLSEGVHLGFYGGEPLLRPRFVERCIEYATSLFGRKRLTYGLTTNGTCLNERTSRMLVENNFSVLVSLDGPRPVHDRYRHYARGGPTFDSITRSLERLRHKYPDYYRRRIAFNMVLAPPYEYAAVREFVRSFPLLKDNEFRLTSPSECHSTFFDRFTPADLNQEALKHGAEQFVNDLSSGVIKDIRLDPDRLPSQMFLRGVVMLCWRLVPGRPLSAAFHPGGICTPGQRRLFVTTDGKFYPCEKVNSTEELFCIGSVDRGLDVPKIISMIDEYTNLHDACKDCYAIRNCGICFVDTSLNGVFNKREKCIRCESVRSQLHASLINLAEMIERNIPVRDYAKYVKVS